jgi:hypothetical protein
VGVKRVVMHIDSLVLKGFRYGDRRAIAAALQDELVRVLAAPEKARQLVGLGSTPQVRIGNVNMGADSEPAKIGAAVGSAIGKGLIR